VHINIQGYVYKYMYQEKLYKYAPLSVKDRLTDGQKSGVATTPAVTSDAGKNTGVYIWFM
jgi:hypothetical protein